MKIVLGEMLRLPSATREKFKRRRCTLLLGGVRGRPGYEWYAKDLTK